jgi:hypothetical protein
MVSLTVHLSEDDYDRTVERLVAAGFTTVAAVDMLEATVEGAANARLMRLADDDAKIAELAQAYLPDLVNEQVLQMRDELDAFFKKEGLWDPSCTWYTKKEWEFRGETVGIGAALTLVAEGPLMNALMYGNHHKQWTLYNTMNDIAARHGYYPESGSSWSFHFYAYVS